MKCPRCQHENETGTKFCEECAAPLARTCAKCGPLLRGPPTRSLWPPEVPARQAPLFARQAERKPPITQRERVPRGTAMTWEVGK